MTNLLSRFIRNVKSQLDLYKEVSERPPLDKLIKALALINTSRRIYSSTIVQHHSTTQLELQRSVRELLSPNATAKVVVKKSSIPNSGVGIYAAEYLPLGSVVCLYPGRIFSKFSNPPQADSFSDSGAYFEQSLEPPSTSMYVLIRAPDGGSIKIDAGELETNTLEYKQLVSTCGINASSGHLINHPPLGISPNVIDVSIDIPILEDHDGGDVFVDLHNGRLGTAPYHIFPWKETHKFPLWWSGLEITTDGEEGTGLGRRELKSGILTGLLPPLTDADIENETFFNSTEKFKRSCQVPAICFVALTDIEQGTELFLDYSYHGGELPSWYKPVCKIKRWENYEKVLLRASQLG